MSATAASVLTHSDGLDMNLGNMGERQNLLCGLPIKIALEIFEKNAWFDPTGNEEVINGVLYKPRVVKVVRDGDNFLCYTVSPDTEYEDTYSIGAYTLEERQAIVNDINEPVTNKMLAPLLFSALDNGGAMRLLKTKLEKNGVPKSRTECIAMAHLIWTATQRNLKCIMADPVCQAVVGRANLTTLTLEMFKSSDSPEKQCYYEALLELIVASPTDLQATFELDWNRFCANAKMLGYPINL